MKTGVHMFRATLAMFPAAATLSLSASAGYVQYDFSGSFNDGDGVDGYFIQDEDTKVVAFYEFNTIGGCVRHVRRRSADGTVW
ncbi:hypothetical protein KY495_22170 [Massilia sp. PAMC28688]|uniref:hypothetical protein n=1 Tax=Massilia sp. PAMC28688 TaxID=2861283 RepID=UPI001C627BBB|nr:hypothetical protein [Massilia sp. PAMC28688]QYF93346.1 hypothetical protein KY495_22170 [Massilia sp. PAMC28688]